jgi:hypothetical protein
MTTPDELRAQATALEAQATQLETPLTQADVHRLYQERRYDEIVQAQKAGRLNNLFNPNKEKTA